MRVHQARVTIACTYGRHREEGYEFPASPEVWSGEWKITDQTAVSVNDDNHECIILYENTVSIFQPDEAKTKAALDEWCQRLSLDETCPYLFAPDRWSRREFSILDAEIIGTREVPMVHKVELPWSLLVDPTMSLHGMRAKPQFNSVRFDTIFQALHDLYRSAEGYDEKDYWTTWTTRSLLNGSEATDISVSAGRSIRSPG